MPTPDLARRTVRAALLAASILGASALAACDAAPAEDAALPASEQADGPASEVLTPTLAAAAATMAPSMPALADPAQPVAIVVRDFAYDTSAITFTTGVTYHLIITNTGAISHELRVLSRGESQAMIDMGIAEHAAMGHEHEHASQLLNVTGDELPPGATVERELYFERPGDYEIGCHLPAHLESGMLVYIDVVGEDLAPVSPDDIVVDTEAMHDAPCHRMGTTIMGDCSPDDIERLRHEILGTPPTPGADEP